MRPEERLDIRQLLASVERIQNDNDRLARENSKLIAQHELDLDCIALLRARIIELEKTAAYLGGFAHELQPEQSR